MPLDLNFSQNHLRLRFFQPKGYLLSSVSLRSNSLLLANLRFAAPSELNNQQNNKFSERSELIACNWGGGLREGVYPLPITFRRGTIPEEWGNCDEENDVAATPPPLRGGGVAAGSKRGAFSQKKTKNGTRQFLKGGKIQMNSSITPLMHREIFILERLWRLPLTELKIRHNFPMHKIVENANLIGKFSRKRLAFQKRVMWAINWQ